MALLIAALVAYCNALSSAQLAAIYPHKRFQDPKVRLMIDFMAERCQRLIGKLLGEEPVVEAEEED